jgi:hypothetical protein
MQDPVAFPVQDPVAYTDQDHDAYPDQDPDQDSVAYPKTVSSHQPGK